MHLSDPLSSTTDDGLITLTLTLASRTDHAHPCMLRHVNMLTILCQPTPPTCLPEHPPDPQPQRQVGPPQLVHQWETPGTWKTWNPHLHTSKSMQVTHSTHENPCPPLLEHVAAPAIVSLYFELGLCHQDPKQRSGEVRAPWAEDDRRCHLKLPKYTRGRTKSALARQPQRHGTSLCMGQPVSVVMCMSSA